MKPRKRSFTISGHRTSVSLEPPFWQALRDIAELEAISIAGLVARIDQQRGPTNLSSAIRLYILAHYQAAAEIVGKSTLT
jgi:predicted DNA-binding ribbon-helix-helix protein